MASLTQTPFVMPSQPLGLVSDGLGNIWVNGAELHGPLWKVKGLDGSILATTSLTPATTPLDQMAFDGTDIWVPMGGGTLDAAVYVVNAAAAIIHMFTAATHQHSTPAAILYDGTDMWILCNAGAGPGALKQTVYKMSLAGAVLGHVTGSSNSGLETIPELCFDGTSIWFTDAEGNLWQVNAAACTLTNELAYGTYPDPNSTGQLQGCLFDGTSIWFNDASSGAPGTIYKVNPATGALIATFASGQGPGSMAFDGTNIWIVNTQDNTITILTAASGALVGTFPVDSADPPFVGLEDIVWDPATNTMWVTTNTSHSLIKLKLSLASAGGQFEGTYAGFATAGNVAGGTK
jgi:hypothetical protein